MNLGIDNLDKLAFNQAAAISAGVSSGLAGILRRNISDTLIVIPGTPELLTPANFAIELKVFDGINPLLNLVPDLIIIPGTPVPLNRFPVPSINIIEGTNETLDALNNFAINLTVT